MNGDGTIRVGAEMPRISGAEAAGPARLVVTWAAGARAGRRETVDLAPLLRRHRFYEPLRADTALFASVRVADGGTVLEWDGGRIDMPATSVERLAAEGADASVMTG